MNLQDIEALGFAELKAKRDDAIEALKKLETPPVLAARLVKHLLDAKHRDEKLAEQGRTITALQDGLAAAKAQTEIAQREIADLHACLQKSQADLEAVRLSARETSQADKAALASTMASLRAESDRALRFKQLAFQGRSAMADAAKLLNNELARLAVDTANQGGG